MESSTGSDPNHYKFIGKERDSESGLDDFGARYYVSRLGSFMQPNPEQISGFNHLLDPQGWNGYSYVRNSPTVFVDPHGAIYEDCGDHTLFRGNGAICGQNQSGADPGYRQDDGNVEAHNQIAQLEEPEREEERPEEREERALEPVESTPAEAKAPAVDPVLARHSPEDIQAVRNGADSVDPQLAGAIRQKDLFDSIASGGMKVTRNPLGPNQEANITITSPLQPGVKLNLRLEMHSLTPGGPPVRHVNVELVTPRTATSPRTITNEHITQ